MRITASLFIVFALSIQAQANLWVRVDPVYNGPRLTPVSLTLPQKRALSRLFKTSGQLDAWECGGNEELLEGLSASSIPLSPKQEILLVTAGEGCARGGQGANGAMWLVRFERDQPIFLATPDQDFNGWLYSIQPTANFGYRDVVLGWHMGAGEADLSYFRFNGKVYECIGTARDITDDSGSRIIPNPTPTRPSHP